MKSLLRVSEKNSGGKKKCRDLSLRFRKDLFHFKFYNEEGENVDNEDNTGKINNLSRPSWATEIEKGGSIQPTLSEISKIFLNEKNASKLRDGDGKKGSNNIIINMETLLEATGQKALDFDEDTYNSRETVLQQSSLGAFPTIEKAGDGDNAQTLKRNIKDLPVFPSSSPSFDLSKEFDLIIKEATQQVESLLNDASPSFSPEKMQELITKASESLSINQNSEVFKTTIDGLVASAEAIAREQGLDVREATEQARATTKYTADFLQAANDVLLAGYVNGGVDRGDYTAEEFERELNIPLSKEPEKSKPLLSAFKSAQSIPKKDFIQIVKIGAKMSELAGGIYQNTIPITHKLGHAIVANGTTADTFWMITDSIGYEEDYTSATETVTQKKPILIRTVTIKGFDASDETVNKERLLNQICTPDPVLFGDKTRKIFVHHGLLGVAKEIYTQVIPYIDLAGPTHKIVFNGHSIGGSLAILLLLLLTEDRGDSFVRQKVLRAFTFGSQPIALSIETTESIYDGKNHCPILHSFGLPATMVYGYVQPWDPILRLFSPIDAMYPLVDDLGKDGVSLYANGPQRALRPIIRSILESWEGWPYLRKNLLGSSVHNYQSVGMQHLLLPDPGRYLTDRLLSVNMGAPPLEEVIRISPDELYLALEDAFPMNAFSISFVSTAIRSFIHHFYPAYESALAVYAEKEVA